MYVSGGITDDLSIGIGVFTPYGLTIKWPDGWAGRQLITQSSLATFYVNPTVAYKIGPLRIGAGFQLVRGTVELKQDIRFGDQDGSADLGGAAWGVGGNVGVQLEAIKQYLSFGVHYRSAVKLNFDDGKAHFNNVPAGLGGHHPRSGGEHVGRAARLAHDGRRDASDQEARRSISTRSGSAGASLHSIDLTFPNDASGSLNKLAAEELARHGQLPHRRGRRAQRALAAARRRPLRPEPVARATRSRPTSPTRRA